MWENLIRALVRSGLYALCLILISVFVVKFGVLS